MTSPDPPSTPAPRSNNPLLDMALQPLLPDQMTALERRLTAMKCRECGEGMDPEMDWFHEPCSRQQEYGAEIRALRAQLAQATAERDQSRAVVDAARAYATIVRQAHGINIPWQACDVFLAALDQAQVDK
jgi:hypothetical protein